MSISASMDSSVPPTTAAHAAMSPALSPLQEEVVEIILTSLNLKNIDKSKISPETGLTQNSTHGSTQDSVGVPPGSSGVGNGSQSGAESPSTLGTLGLDSIDVLELIVNFEQHFQIKIGEQENYAQHFRNIASVAKFIECKKMLV